MAKKIFIIVSAVVLTVAAIVCAIFLIKSQGIEPDMGEISLEGTWRIFKTGNESQGVEYFVFDSETVAKYDGSNTEPAFSSDYIKNGNMITVALLGEDFSIEKKTDTVLLLYNSNSEYLLVAAKDSERTAPVTYSRADFVGNYDVLLHANGVYGEEVITFDGDKFICARDGATYLSSTFSVENNRLNIITSGGELVFDICYVDGNVMRFAEHSTDERGRAAYLAWEIVLQEG